MSSIDPPSEAPQGPAPIDPPSEQNPPSEPINPPSEEPGARPATPNPYPPSSGFSAWSRMMTTISVKTPAAALRVNRARAMMRAATRR